MSWSGRFKNGEYFNDLTDDELNRFESEIDESTVRENPSESSSEMRDRAKKEYASDVLQQDSLNAIEIKEAQQQIWKENVFLPSILIVFLFLYFLPTYICFKRKVSRKKTSMIFFLNLFSGWTFFMWLILGIWSLSDFELK